MIIPHHIIFSFLRRVSNMTWPRTMTPIVRRVCLRSVCRGVAWRFVPWRGVALRVVPWRGVAWPGRAYRHAAIVLRIFRFSLPTSPPHPLFCPVPVNRMNYFPSPYIFSPLLPRGFPCNSRAVAVRLAVLCCAPRYRQRQIGSARLGSARLGSARQTAYGR